MPTSGSRRHFKTKVCRRTALISFVPIGLLKSGVSFEQAQAQLNTIAAQLATEYPDTNKDWNLRLEPAQRAMVGDVRQLLSSCFSARWDSFF